MTQFKQWAREILADIDEKIQSRHYPKLLEARIATTSAEMGLGPTSLSTFCSALPNAVTEPTLRRLAKEWDINVQSTTRRSFASPQIAGAMEQA